MPAPQLKAVAVAESKALRVLHVLPYFRPAYGFGGPAVGTDILTAGLADAGCLVTVWTSNVGHTSGARLKAGYEGTCSLAVQRYRYLSRALFRATGILLTPGMVLDALDSDKKPDIIHLHDFRSVQAMCALLYAKRTGAPLLLHPHGTLKSVLGREMLKHAYDRFVGERLLGQASRVIVLSEAEAEEARDAGVPDAKVVVVQNGVRIPAPRENRPKGNFRKKHQINDDCFLVLFLGRIRVSKGVLLLLEAFSEFNREFPNSVLAVCGSDDGAGAKLRREANRLGSRVILPGFLAASEKAEALNDSDAFCLPSLVETQSVAVLEAASYGLPIIAGKTSVPRDFVEEEAGVFVDLTKGSLADALGRVAESPGLGAACGSRARSLVERRYSIDRQLSAILDLYSEISHENGLGGRRHSEVGGG